MSQVESLVELCWVETARKVGWSMRHVVEVDQSIKIEDSGSTVLAFADGIAYAIEVSANVKLAALQALYDLE